jgi:uncharacterized membrane protein
MYEGSYTPPPAPGSVPPPPPTGGTVSPNRNLMVVLSYLWILALVPLLTEKDDREVQWHAKHGLVILIAEVIAHVGLWIVMRIAGRMLGCGACLLGFVPLALSALVLVVRVLCIMKGVEGKRFLIPGLSDFADKL